MGVEYMKALIVIALFSRICSASFEHTETLADGVTLSWEYGEDSIDFEVRAPTRGWIGLGFSPGRTMAGADIVMMGDRNGNPYAVDAHARRNGRPSRDRIQNWFAISSSESHTHTTVVVRRMFRTGDNDDRDITEGMMNVIWAYGSADIDNQPNFYHGRNRGFKSLELLRPQAKDEDVEPEETSYKYSETLAEGVTVRWKYHDETIDFEVRAPTRGWVGFGFSPGRNMAGADIVMMGDNNGIPYAVDAHAAGNGRPSRDWKQNWQPISSSESSTHTTVVARRMLTTGDPNDMDITSGMMNIIWAYGPFDISGQPNFYHGKSRGSKTIEILRDIDQVIEEVEAEEMKDFKYTETMTSGYTFSWDYDDENIEFKVSAPTRGWVGLGFSPGHNMGGADIVMMGHKNGMPYAVDTIAARNGRPMRDRVQNWITLSSSENDTHTTVTAKRMLKTRDNFDRDITGGMMNVIWAFGPLDIKEQPNFYHGKNRGLKVLELLRRDEDEDDIINFTPTPTPHKMTTSTPQDKTPAKPAEAKKKETPCSVLGGECLNTKKDKCVAPNVFLVGLCTNSKEKEIQCCLKDPGTDCEFMGGVCQDKKLPCKTKLHKGLCQRSPKNVRCCMKTLTCEDYGGECLDVKKKKCTPGMFIKKLCPGKPKNILCCIKFKWDLDDMETTGKRGEKGVEQSEKIATADCDKVKKLRKLFERAEKEFGIDKEIIAAIASRESNVGKTLKNGWGDNGNGYGVMQVDKNSNTPNKKDGPEGYANIKQGTKILLKLLEIVIKFRPKLSPEEQLRIAISSYNAGPMKARFYGDAATTQFDYSSDVLARAKYFKRVWKEKIDKKE